MLYRSYVFFLSLSIISCAISVSLSQLFLAISFVTFIFLRDKPTFRTELVLILCLFYSWQLFSFFYHWVATGFSLETITLAWKTDMKDMLIFSAFFVIQGVKPEDRNKIKRAIIIFGYIILVTGLIASFSPIRLSRLISDLYRPSTTWPFQHHYGNLFGLNFYLPIGLMNTHLTFGGLMSFVFPYFFFQVYESWKKNESLFVKLAKVFLLASFSLVFLLNNARSAMMGAFFSIAFGIYILIFVEKEFSRKFIRNIGIIILAVALLLSVAYLKSPSLQKVIGPLFGSAKHTDSGRTFIWDSTFPLLSENPIFGIGPGAYPKEIEIARKNKSIEHKELSYFYEVTQRGHAHNDYFYLGTIFGYPQVLFYFLLGGYIVFGFSTRRIAKEHMFLTIALSGFFFSGLLQCYFQDDEILIVFYYLLGYYHMFLKNDVIIA